jgi:FtsH-binding integral membrane protein
MGDFYYFGHVKGRQPTIGKDFYTKVLPTMFIAALIWLFSTMYFGGLLGTPAIDLSTFTLTEIIIAIVIFIIIWVLLIGFAFMKKNTAAMIVFFIASVFNGIVQSFIVSYVSADIGLELARSLFVTSAVIGVFATGGAMALGYSLRDKISKHYCLLFMLFGFLYGIMEVVMLLIFGYNNLLVDFLMLGWIFGIIVFDAATLPGKIKRGYWMMAAIDVFFDYVMMVMRIFILLSNLSSKKKK